MVEWLFDARFSIGLRQSIEKSKTKRTKIFLRVWRKSENRRAPLNGSCGCCARVGGEPPFALNALHEFVDAGVEELVGARVEVELEVHDEAEPAVRLVVALDAHRHEGLLLGERVRGLRAAVRTRLQSDQIKSASRGTRGRAPR